MTTTTFTALRAAQKARKDAETREWMLSLIEGRTPTEAAQIAGMDRAHMYRLAASLGVVIPKREASPHKEGPLAWIYRLPDAKREEYRFLRSKRLPVDEARRIVGG